MAIKTEIELHKASEELPENSGLYLVWSQTCGKCFYTDYVHYSAKYKKFNACDDEHIADKHSFNVEYWAEIPDLLAEIDG